MLRNQIFTGTIRHRRFAPKRHFFSYRLFMFCFDIGGLPNLYKGIKQVSFEQFNWFSFHRKKYLNHPEISLDEAARQLVMAKFNTHPKGKIYLLTHLSCFGYCFNPISLYFIFDEANQKLDYLIIEVTNTPWGEKHNYVLSCLASSNNELYRFQFQKELHVSPFMAMNYEYQLKLKVNSQKIFVHMENHIDGKKDFDATLMLTAVSARKGTSFKTVFKRYPLITYKVAAAIYWQALKLWLKGIAFHSHPKTDKRT